MQQAKKGKRQKRASKKRMLLIYEKNIDLERENVACIQTEREMAKFFGWWGCLIVRLQPTVILASEQSPPPKQNTQQTIQNLENPVRTDGAPVCSYQIFEEDRSERINTRAKKAVSKDLYY